jgi:predicted DNA-binding protein
MTPRRQTTMRIDDELLEGLEALKERDGIPVSEQVRRAIRAWLDAKGVRVKKSERKRAGTRKRS